MKLTHHPTDLKEISLTKVWIWILETYYSTASSKFYWPEFYKKVFKKDDGKELKRRMITYSVKSMSETLHNELTEITTVHGKVSRENYGSEFPVVN